MYIKWIRRQIDYYLKLKLCWLTDVDFSATVILLGTPKSGKSSVISRFIDDKFVPDEKIHISVDFQIKELEIPHRNLVVKLNIIEVSDLSTHSNIVNLYVKNASAILFCYDITNKDTFIGMQKWYSLVNDNGNYHFPKLLLGTKCDLVENRTVNSEEVKKFCLVNNIENIDVSAKENIKIKTAFISLVEQINKQCASCIPKVTPNRQFLFNYCLT